MGSRSNIEWTDASWTPIRARNLVTGKVGWHCEHVSPGCVNCYAEGMNTRLGTGLTFKPGRLDGEFGPDLELFLDEKLLLEPLRWKKPKRVFVCSMTDLFAAFVPDEWIDRLFAVMALCPQHTFQVLTKRSAQMRVYCSADRREAIFHAAVDLASSEPISFDWPLANVWLGVSAEDQRRAEERVPDLLATPAAARFVSAEPLLGPIDFSRYFRSGWVHEYGQERRAHPVARSVGIDWIITGGESGPNARPMLRSCATSIRDQCAAAGVAFFHKQNGEWIDADEWLLHIRERGFDVISRGAPVASPMPFVDASEMAEGMRATYELQSDGTTLIRVGKTRAGRALDGQTHDAFPEPRP